MKTIESGEIKRMNSSKILLILNRMVTIILMVMVLEFHPANLFSQRSYPQLEAAIFNLSSERESKIKNFHVMNMQGKVFMQWFNQNDKEDGLFIISRSDYKKDFKIIGIKEDYAAMNPDNIMQCFFDNKPVPGIIYYRILKIYKDGSFIYSETEKVELPFKKNISEQPNPVL